MVEGLLHPYQLLPQRIQTKFFPLDTQPLTILLLLSLPTPHKVLERTILYLYSELYF